MHPMPLFAAAALILSPLSLVAGTTEFCLDGEFDLGARYQGMEPSVSEFVPTRWCVVSEDASTRVIFAGSGKSNPDMVGGWTVALVPDLVRIINADDPPDVEFSGVDTIDESLRLRRIDPHRLLEEFGRLAIARQHPGHVALGLAERGRTVAVDRNRRYYGVPGDGILARSGHS
jgi:hypothetical protein